MGSPECGHASHSSSPHPRTSECQFQIAWSINPHMDVAAAREKFAGDRAIEQHASLQSALMRAGAEITEIPFIHGAFDSVFVKDMATLFADEVRQWAVLANPLYAERKKERTARARALENQGFEVIAIDERLAFEGGDVVRRGGRTQLFLGHGFRSVKRAARALEHHSGMEVIPLELADPYLYHLDTALGTLRDGTVLACREAFSPASWRQLEAHLGQGFLIEIPYAEALRFAANFVEVNDSVIVGTSAPELSRSLRAHGKTPICVELDQFQLSGGSAACLVAPVHHPEPVVYRLPLPETGRSRGFLPGLRLHHSMN